ncbi:MAG: tetratricopeptide repeat protein [Bacteroidota bacterium]|nr:tetratricopeptide repeat protein [Bacteroidota bacterium]
MFIHFLNLEHIFFFNRGLAYLKLGQHLKAINDFTETIKLKPNEAKAYFNRGISKSILGLDACSDNKKACSLGRKIACELFRDDNCN